MKRKFLGTAMVAVIAVAAGWNMYQGESNVVLSDIGLANIEALARGEITEADCDRLCRYSDTYECYLGNGYGDIKTCHFSYPR